jgi:amino acid adenylation domain-containing protein
VNEFSSEVSHLSTERRELLERLLRQGRVAPPPGILPRSEVRDIPLSFAQEQLWFLDQLDPGNPAYNIAATVRFAGALDPVTLKQALRTLVCRHDILRTTFVVRAGQPVQVVAPTLLLDLPLVDLRHLSEGERESRAQGLAVTEARKPFDLACGPLLRANLLRLADEAHLLVLTVHHIAADCWSMRVLVRELAETYEAHTAGQEALLPELPAQYADHAILQRQSLHGEVLDEQLAYWRQRLAGAELALNLPTDHPRPAVQSNRGARHPIRLPASLAEAVRTLGRREGCTPFMVLLAALQALLSRYSGQEDLCVGSPIAGRERPEVKGLVGFFVNTLVLRGDLSGDPSFAEFLARVRETCLGAYAHQDLPFERLVEDLRPRRDPSRSPLFQVLFSFDHEPQTCLALPGLALDFSEVDTATAKFDLSLYVREGAAGLGGYLEYDTDLFEGETAARLLGHWQVLLQAATADPGLRLSQLPLLTEAERRRLLLQWNDTRAPLPAQQCLHRLVETQVERTPGAIALVHGQEGLSYAELNRRANRLAHHLRGQGVGPDQLVGVCLGRSPEMVVALLGILKAGGAYLPLDPSLPADRLAFLLDDARVGMVVTQRHFAERFSSVGAHTVCMDVDAPTIACANDSNLSGGASCHHLAYVLYTSGSTGRPKGVAIEHRSAAVFVNWLRGTLGPEELAGVLAGTSIGFDISIVELFVPLSCGGKVILAENALALPQLPAASEVTLISTVPSVMAELLEQGGVPASVRSVILAGEALPHPLARRIYRQETIQRLYNMYGPTETTVYSTWALVPPGAPEPPTIGRPIANTRVHVLDGHMQPVPVGVPGELYIGGAGLARGYLNRPELTAERFIPNPFGDTGDRLYRTGDLVRWLPSGELDYLGRLDHQVKVRGFRIEPGEIEAALLEHPAVRQAVVVAREVAPGDRRLVAYVVADGHSAPSPPELQQFLRGQLPDYMVPSAFVTLEALPLSPNGKIDRKALPAPQEVPAQQQDAGAPRTPAEEIVAGVWAEVLGLERIGPRANFFDLGGHSLLATRVAARLGDLFSINLPVAALFEAPTVAELARRIAVGQAGGPARTAEPIRPAAPEERAALSFAQQRLWFLDQWQPGSALYNLAAAMRLSGPLDEAALERSLREVARRHEVLRTTFRAAEGTPVAVIADEPDLSLPVVDLGGLPEGEREAEARRLAAEEARRPFDLSAGPLLRANLVRLGVEDHLLVVAMHHIVSDGWSVGVLNHEVAALYAAYAAGGQSPLPALPVQYADYAAWQRRWLHGEALQEQLDYWRDQLADAPAALDLPTDRPRPALPDYRGATVRFELPGVLAQSARALARDEGCTLYMVLLAAFQALLHRYSGQDDFCVGTPVAGRGRPEAEGLVGCFVNTLVFRADLSGDPNFAALLGQVRETCLGAYAHQDLPFERLVEEIQPDRDRSRAPLFQVMFALQNASQEALELAGLRLEPWDVDSGTSKFDLTLRLAEWEGSLRGELEYSTELYEPATAQRLVGHYRTLLEGATANPDCCVSELPLLTADERHQLLIEWNRTEADIPDEGCIHRLFEAQAQRTPEAVALVFGEEEVTFRELNRRANQLAHYLRWLGVAPEVLVGICVERSIEMVVGLLGILKAGGAYVPLDPAFPKERIAYMLNDARVRLVLTQQSLEAGLSRQQARLVRLDTDAEAIRRHSTANPTGWVATDNLAYVMYTSGSTGRPKGVQITHGCVVNFLGSMSREPGLAAQDTLLAVTTLSFDIAGLEIFLPLMVGARLMLVPHEVAQDGKRLAEKLATSAATVMQATPVTWQMLLEAGWSGSPSLKILCGGEAMPPDLARQLAGRCASLWNVYGPTETTIWSTVHRVNGRGGPVPIGRPIANTQVYVTDSRWQPVPVGVVGELLIGGAGLGRGYLSRPELTAEKFIPNPHSDTPGSRLYRTGDLARWLPSGELECLGRLDHQVKVRGFRIEPGEIEAALLEHPALRQAVVVAREVTPGDRRLVAYLVADEPPGPSPSDLQRFLRERLPDYMVPPAFVTLEVLPLTPNGKVDRNALPPPEEAPAQQQGADAPRTPAEEVVAGVWAEILGLERVGREDNFFDLGGHSLLATRVAARLRDLFSLDFPVAALFEAPTVAELARRIAVGQAGGPARIAEPIRPAAHEERTDLSFAQQRLWFLDQWQPGGAVYNVPAALRLSGPLDAAALERSLQEIVRRHEVLRTTFPSAGGQPAQVVAEDLLLRLPVIDLSELPQGERETEARRLAAEEARRPFDLSAGPLLRVCLLRLASDDHLFLIAMHHIVSDGWSVGVLNREVAALYGAYVAGGPSPLPALPVQYADYAAWQRRWLHAEALEEQLDYWRDRLAGAPAALDLPTDRPRPALPDYRGATVRFELPGVLAQSARALARREGCTLYMVLLAAFQALLHRYSGQDDFCVGSPIAGRNRAEVEGLVGFFVNTLVLRADLSGDPSFAALLGRAREACLGAYAHQDLPFERLVEEIQPERDASRQPLFQVMFVLQNAPQQAPEVPGLRLEPWDVDSGTSKFDLSLFLVEQDGGLRGTLEYSTELFEADTAQRLVGHYHTLLHAACAEPNTPVSRLPLLTAQEWSELSAWNDTRVDYPQQHLLHHLIQEQARRSPDAEAVRFESGRLTYRQLDRRAALLAQQLRTLGVGPDVAVGVCMERSLELVVALLGVLKAGGAYAPLDPDYPSERLAFMLADCVPPVLLTQSRLAGRLPQHSARLYCLDDGWSGGDAEAEAPPDAGLTPESLAYVIYTSGSTGRPKGAMNTHRGICNRLLWMQQQYRLGPADCVLQKTPYSFDVSVWEFFWPLLAGARLVLARPGGHKEPAYLAELIRQEGVSVCHFVPSMLQAFLLEPALEHNCVSLRDVVCSGEALPYELQERFFARLGCRLHNLYGPTEAAVDVTYWECRRGDPRRLVPIGRPVANTRMHVLDKHQQEVPVGVPGELHIAGVQLARGYLNRPELTAERFIEHPDLGRLYRTGDVGRWLGDGTLEYLGRTDHQVKLRGLRIELGEVEAALAEHPSVREAVVLARQDSPGDTRLVAYLVPGGEAGLSTEELRGWLRGKLPEYMVPAAFVVLDRLPLSPNGKVDRHALPVPDAAGARSDDSYVRPRGPVEETVARIWAEVLGVERVGTQDNFFDLGGHSLLAIQVLSRLRQAFSINLPLRTLFEEPTVANLARVITQSQAESTEDLIGKAVAADADQLVAHLDQLSDAEIESLLRQELAEEEINS